MASKDDAGRRLQLLQDQYLKPGARGPAGRRATRVHPEAPINLDILDHITSSITEVVQHVRAVAPEAEPRPAALDGLYDWFRDSTPYLDEEALLVREAVIYRQDLEHAIRAGNHRVVRKHPCPGCGCWGLFWRSSQERAACTNSRCTDEDGLSTTWELKQLAYEYTLRQKNLRTNAT